MFEHPAGFSQTSMQTFGSTQATVSEKYNQFLQIKCSKFIKLWRRLSSFILLTRELFNKTFPKCSILKTRVNFACGCSAELNLYYLEIISCWSCLEEWWWTWATIWCMMRRWSRLWHEQYFWLLTFVGLLTVEEQTEFFLINTLMIWNWKYSVLR